MELQVAAGPYARARTSATTTRPAIPDAPQSHFLMPHLQPWVAHLAPDGQSARFPASHAPWFSRRRTTKDPTFRSSSSRGDSGGGSRTCQEPPDTAVVRIGV